MTQLKFNSDKFLQEFLSHKANVEFGKVNHDGEDIIVIFIEMDIKIRFGSGEGIGDFNIGQCNYIKPKYITLVTATTENLAILQDLIDKRKLYR